MKILILLFALIFSALSAAQAAPYRAEHGPQLVRVSRRHRYHAHKHGKHKTNRHHVRRRKV
jgi:hypothetical protein